mmetsp:Transcript_16596/g.23560  ORF Transcript_16596/g.23560 Transcript_16596/m.23560 type:complete len:316 (+) Transcript_16596:135-1082(+)|eukprot:CAMPEP_0184854822 /NCGR_PEP_ID=MMETSP0580-20130426/212_1 /TAXON_ID=1118495 /ORGANISM="Dactyliosolen fragilissimus" /LENGTH=315 /DNA_ID=CAMNT_0027349161 /DNA_START=65 /DNA_END=1012 /DNA_ORIENTATION=+
MSAISRQQRVKGQNYLDEAAATLSKKTWFASSTEQKNEEAAELYEKAANAFKVASAMDDAGAAYVQAAALYQDKLKNVGEASKCLSKAGACYKKTNPVEAIAAYRSSISLLCDAGRLTQAAKLSKEVAEIFENEEGSGEEEANHIILAIESYEQAAELFEMEQQKSQSNQCLAKVAELRSAALEPPDLLRAAEIYDDLGRHCLDSNLLKFNAKGYFLQCVICHLANGDSIGASQAMQRVESMDYTFGESREGKFSTDLVSSVENFDSESFATACFEFDRISKLDPWKTTMLVKVKRSIDGGQGVGDELEDDVDLT